MNFRSFTKSLLAAVLASAFTVACAGAPQDTISFTEGEAVSVTAYEVLSVYGDGTVAIEHGDNFSVTIVSGAEKTEILRKGQRLIIRCPKKRCRGASRRAVTIMAPTLEGLSVIGDIEMKVGEGFKSRDNLDLSIVGDGKIEAWSLPAREVNVSIVGDGEIMVTVSEELDVSIIGDGEVTYTGSPEVDRSIVGGGRIEPRQ